MSENNGNQIIGETKESEVKTAELPKKVRVGFVFLSLVPAAVFLAIQTMTQMPFIILASWWRCMISIMDRSRLPSMEVIAR